MLDQTKSDSEDEDLTDDTQEVEEQAQAEGQDGAEGDGGEDEEAELSITLGDDAPEDEEDAEIEAELGDKGKRALKRLREVAAEKAREAREAKAKLAAIEAERAGAQADAPKKPTLEGCGFDEAEYEKQMAAYVVAQAEAQKAQEAAAAEAKRNEEDYQQRFEKYGEAKKSLRVADFDEAEDTVRQALNVHQQAVIIRNAAKPEEVIYALGRSKKALAELAAIKDIDRFTYRLAKLEGEIKVTKKTPPPVESRLRGGSAGSAVASNLEQQLEAAEKEAAQTGNRTKVLAIKKQMQAAGRAA